MKRVELEIEGMTCDSCAAAVRRALASVEGVREAEASFPGSRATVGLDEGDDPRGLVEAVERAGYRARVRAGTEAPPAAGGENGRDGGNGGEGGGSSRHLLILGAGSAAFAAAIRASELGARVTMVERGTMGGTCVNVGCVPSKTLIRAAEIRHLREDHPFDGIPVGNGRADMGALVAQKDELVRRLRGTKYRDVLGSLPGVEYVEGEARFADPGTVEVRLGDGSRRELVADRILIATGAQPWVPPIPGLDEFPYWTSDEALSAEQVPERLLVVGGSAVGAELAQMFARLGSSVTLLEALPTLIPNEDPDLGEALARAFRMDGIEVHTRAKATYVSRGSDGTYRLVAEVEGAERAFEADRLLMATGRRPDPKALGLEAAGVRADPSGFIQVDRGLRTSQPHIFAAGDCTPLPQFVYVAAKAGTVAAENAVGGGGAELDLSAVPAVTFTDPQAASVGLTEAEARTRERAATNAEGGEQVARAETTATERGVVARTLPLEHVPRALANRNTRGLVKIVAREEDGRILGVHILSPAAGEVIQTAVLALKGGLTVGELAGTLFPYLTEVEGLKLAAQTFEREVERLSCCAG